MVRSRVATLVAVLLLVVGCGGPGRSPESAVRALAEAAEDGDVDAVMKRLGPSTRARLEADARRAAEQAGRRELDAKDLLAAGWTTPRFRLVEVRLVERRDHRAVVQTRGSHGESERVELVEEPDGWKVELP